MRHTCPSLAALCRLSIFEHVLSTLKWSVMQNSYNRLDQSTQLSWIMWHAYPCSCLFVYLSWSATPPPLFHRSAKVQSSYQLNFAFPRVYLFSPSSFFLNSLLSLSLFGAMSRDPKGRPRAATMQPHTPLGPPAVSLSQSPAGDLSSDGSASGRQSRRPQTVSK